MLKGVFELSMLNLEDFIRRIARFFVYTAISAINRGESAEFTKSGKNSQWGEHSRERTAHFIKRPRWMLFRKRTPCLLSTTWQLNLSRFSLKMQAKSSGEARSPKA